MPDGPGHFRRFYVFSPMAGLSLFVMSFYLPCVMLTSVSVLSSTMCPDSGIDFEEWAINVTTVHKQHRHPVEEISSRWGTQRINRAGGKRSCALANKGGSLCLAM